MEQAHDSLKQTARTAGLLYLLLAISAPYGIMYVSSQVVVRGDAVATASNIVEHEFLFRTGIVSHLFSQVMFVFLALVLYKLLKAVNTHLARIMVALVIVQIPIVFLLETLKFTSMMVFKGDALAGMPTEQAQNLAMMLLRSHGYGINILAIFFGLWLVPLGRLFYLSGFMPRILGVLLIVAGVGYTIDSLTFLLAPAYRGFTNTPALTLSGLGELSTLFWLLIKGVKTPETRLASQS
jgi:hypothetical protein